MTSIETTIRDYILDSFLTDGRSPSLNDDDDLLTILDSLQILRMVMDLEKMYDIKVDNSELTAENLGTVARLAAFVAGKPPKTVC
ncbi:MAG: acyl carrier protein [Planctomycetia bacterium]|nr:acyl carrier protein [Planctomycetia bacterium]